MMKTKLKFFLVLLSLIIGGVNGAWAQNETYDFATWGAESSPVINYGDNYPNSVGLTCNYLESITTGSGTHNLYVSAKRFACRQWTSGTQRGWYITSSGLRCYGHPNYAPELAICGMWNGDRVKIYYTSDADGGIQFVNTGSAKVNGTFVTAGQSLGSEVEFTAVANGDVILKGTSNYTYITKIEFYYQSGSPNISFIDDAANEKPLPRNMKVADEKMAYTSVTPWSSTPTFTSSRPSVATIDWYGYIKAVGVGTTTITASLTVGNTTVTDSYTLAVESAGGQTYTCDYTGSGGDYKLNTIVYQHDSNLKQLSFENETYGKTFTCNNFIAVPTTVPTDNIGWGKLYLTNNGIFNNWSGSTEIQIVSIVNWSTVGAHNGDRVKVWFSGGQITATSTNINTTNLVSGQQYTITEDGNVVLSMGAGVTISKIEIEHDWGSPSFTWSDEALANKFNTSSGGKLLKYKITDMNFTEPTAVKVPANATHTVRSLNTDVAIMDEHNFGDVLFVNTGTVNIQGTMKTNGNDYRDTYTVDVWADVAEFTDVNNRYEVTGIGKLQEKEVTAVRGLKMNFGSDEDATLVLYNTDYNAFVAYSINKLTGWRHRDAGDEYSIPTHGSFYKFKALTSGKLRFSGVKNGDENEVVLMDAGNGVTEAITGSPLCQIDANQIGIRGSSDNSLSGNDYVHLTAGHTYYLFGKVPANGDYYTHEWSAYLLTWFSFESDFKLVNIIGGVETEVSYGAAARTNDNDITSVSNVVTIKGVNNPTVSVVGKSGNITTATASTTSSGENSILNVTGISGSGGAIRIKIESSAGTAYFTLTIPYATHTWDFRTGTRTGENAENGQTRAALATEIKSHGINDDPTNYPTGAALGLSGVTRVYRSSNKTAAGVWEHITDPLLVANGNVEGDNGFYIDKTSGLIFVTGAQSFGALETTCRWNGTNYTSYDPAHIHGLTEVDDETEYYFGPEVTTEAEYVYMKTGSKIIFPGVRPGQYIKIYTRRLSSLGDHWRAENLIDLEDKPYTYSGEFQYLGINEDRSSTDGTPDAWAGNNLKGSAIFKVPVNNSTTGSTAYNANNTDISQMPSLTVTNGWVRILKIEILNEYKTDLYLSVNEQGENPSEFYKVDPDSEYGSVVVYKTSNGNVTPNAAAYTYTYEGTVGKIGATHSHTCDYEVIPDASVNVTVTASTTVTGATYNKVTLQYNGGNGQVKIVQREYGDDTGVAARANQHIINKKETYIAVSEVRAQAYPYTWDFTNYNMYQGSTTATNLASATGTNYGTWTSSGTNTFQVNATATINTSMQQLNISSSSYEQVTKPLFAQGGQLSIGSTAVAEVNGLGISRPNGTDRDMYTWKTTSGNFGRATYKYKTYDLSAPITINGSTLSGASTITIPQVNDGMYIFVKSSAEPTVKAIDPSKENSDASLSVLEKNNTNFKVKDGVYLYKNATGITRDVELTLGTGVSVEIVAVTNIVKRIGETGYATESRDCAIDHSYENKLTQHPVRAYAIQTYEGGTYNYRGYPEVKKWGPLNVVPLNIGIVLCEDGTTHDAEGFNSPFFVPAVNSTLTSEQESTLNSVNWMEPQLTESQHYQETYPSHQDGNYYQKFILTKTYYVYSTDPTQNPSEQMTADAVGFYRMRISSTGSDNVMPANSAFLLIKNIPTALWNGGSGARQGMIYLDLEELEANNATKIDDEINADCSTDSGVYYSISGARINGKPTKKGFYIHNGKKVSVK